MYNTNQKIKELTRESLESSSIHAIPNITRNKFKLIKIIWLICFLGSTGTCGWFMSRSLMDFFQYDVVTKSQVEYKTSLMFPVVTICNLTPYPVEFREEINDFLNKLYDNSIEMGDFGTVYYYYYSSINLKKYFSDYSKKLLGRALNQTILECFFNYSPCNLTNDFEFYYDSTYGACYRYNSGKNMLGEIVDQKIVYQSGQANGFSVTLYLGKLTENSNPLTFQNGFNIFITNQSSDASLQEGISISPGFLYKIVLNKYTQSKQQKPFSECIKNLYSVNSYDSECYRKTIMSLNRSYTYMDCFRMCLQKKIGLDCNCQYIEYEYTYFKNMSYCGIIKNFSNIDLNDINEIDACITNSYDGFFKSSKNIEECNCPLECEYSGYNYFVSQAQYPSIHHFDKFLKFNPLIESSNKIKTLEDVRESVARIDVFYDNLRESVITEDPRMSLADLVSNIGGLLGLFLGLSFLSLIEIIEILLQILLVKIEMRKNQIKTINN